MQKSLRTRLSTNIFLFHLLTFLQFQTFDSIVYKIIVQKSLKTLVSTNIFLFHLLTFLQFQTFDIFSINPHFYCLE